MKTPIPVILLTGFLGSGKTTRLRQWLEDPALHDAVLIINELGEVGIDQQTLIGMTDQSKLLSNQCVCCTGLAGLEEVLTDLKWRVLTREQASPPCVIIETTGIADPGPILDSLRHTLHQDFALQACICCIAADTAPAILEADPVALKQIEAASVVLITKSELLPETSALQAQLRDVQPKARIEMDALPGRPLEHHLGQRPAPQPSPAPFLATVPKTPAHVSYESHFETLESGLSRTELVIRLHQLLDRLGDAGTRLKGFVTLDDGQCYRVEHAPASRRIDIAPAPASSDAPQGLVVIRPTAHPGDHHHHDHSHDHQHGHDH